MAVNSCDYFALVPKIRYINSRFSKKLALFLLVAFTNYAVASESTVTIPNTAINDTEIVIDRDYIVDLSTPFSDAGSFGYYYKSGERNFPGKVASIAVGDLVSRIEYQSNEFGSIFNYLPDGGAVFHTGLDLFPTSDKAEGTNTDAVYSIVNGKVINNQREGLVGYKSMVLSKLNYPIKIPRFNYQYTSWISDVTGEDSQRAIGSLTNHLVNEDPVEITHFVSHYLHLDSALRANTNQNVQAGDTVGQLFNNDYTDTVENRTYSYSPHLHFEILLPKYESGSYSVGFFNGYDVYSQVGDRVNQDFGYVDPEEIIAKIKQRNTLLKNLARADLRCTDNDSCRLANGGSVLVNSHVDKKLMAIAQHYLGHDQTLITNEIPNVAIQTKDSCSTEEQLCQYVKYTFDGKTYIVTKNLHVVHIELAAHWHISKDGLPINSAYEQSGVFRQQFQYALTELNGSNLIRRRQDTINVEPRQTSTIQTTKTTIADTDYWVTNNTVNRLYFDIGEYGNDFEKIENIKLSVPYSTKKINVNGNSVYPANNEAVIALFSKHKNQSNSNFTMVGDATFSCLTGELCTPSIHSIANGQIKFKQQSGHGSAAIGVSASFEDDHVYALGFSAENNSNTNGVAASQFMLTLNKGTQCTATNASFMNKIVQFISRKSIGNCDAQ